MDDAVTAQLIADLAERGGMGAHATDYARLWRADVHAEDFAAVDDWASRHGARYVPAESLPRISLLPEDHNMPPLAEVAAHWIVPLDALEQPTIEGDAVPPAA